MTGAPSFPPIHLFLPIRPWRPAIRAGRRVCLKTAATTVNHRIFPTQIWAWAANYMAARAQMWQTRGKPGQNPKSDRQG